MSFFEQLGLAEPILRALNTKGYTEPTPIQREAIPALLDGRDLLGVAQTGTGKTAAFSLPSLHRLAANPVARHPAGCRMLILSPTRELAAQISDNIREYSRYLDLSVQCIFGGLPARQQARKLVPGCDILVATPGRLLDLIEQRALTLQHVEIFVLDEADQMMDLGFIKPLTRIANMLPKERQSLFFSATMPDAIANLGKRFISNPVRVEVAPQSTTAERVEQYSTYIDQKEKQALLTISLRKGIANGEIESALVFTRTKHGADRVVRNLVAAGINAAAIHGNKSQAQRTRALDGFRRGSVPVLVATDIAARGIDVPGVSVVFNFEIPNVAEQYVHRIGRTARAGRSGIAISYVAGDEKPYIRDIERLTGIKLVPAPLPENFIQEAKGLPAPARKGSGAERSDEDRNARFRKGSGGGKPGGRSGGQASGRDRKWRDAEGRSPDQGNYRSRDDRDNRQRGNEPRGNDSDFGRPKNVSHKSGPVTKPVVAAKRRDERVDSSAARPAKKPYHGGGGNRGPRNGGGTGGGGQGGGQSGGGRPQRRKQS
ncbi:DEAD/DEAH box helicase [Pontixanthobacter gangjinensis]|uniref:DEAD/DEAH box helicase n=1 Tax=Pontixanthobacter gangjinensis TaxID=1028742 RepID=A0A6I4SLC0_9SPHN|nr:DEAD/DEAH box helicase [Pontixanthobacter gangjinensis]MXO56515.1 DEAD/DEAH box helicase [Pontixanthobacter gangjinensis]